MGAECGEHRKETYASNSQCDEFEHSFCVIERGFGAIQIPPATRAEGFVGAREELA